MASQFYRPSSFQFPRGPPSPPETTSETIAPGMPVPHLHPASFMLGPDLDNGLANISPDAGSRLRKSSSIPYHSSGLRDRSTSSPQRGGKSLIIVIPPPNLLSERGQSLNSGPYHRLSQGIIMPLLPSMFGQLTAIAREFNFPSTTGIHLYFHYNEGELSLTPRISDDSWATLSNYLSDTPSNERRTLISGKIEFDIDHRIARWYVPWLTSISREGTEATQLYPHTAPFGHFRGESRTTTDGRFHEDDMGDNSAIQQHSAPVRHAPRKLSLVERYEPPSGRSDRPYPLSVGAPLDLPAASHALSPIRQEDEPKSAQQNLNTRVKSWRASALLSPTPLAATGQISLEPPNLPNTIVLNDSPTPESSDPEPLKMDDFAWSISSAGPQSEGNFSPVSRDYARSLRSVHLDSRLLGSVCSTPSVQTSAGPLDYNPFSPEPFQYSALPSPDIAQRFFDDVPGSPLTATSWGAPLSYPSSPVVFSRVPSPDLGHRQYESTPVTPTTATSWGAPLSYPPSPICLSPTPSLDLGIRCAFDDAEESFDHGALHGSAPYSSLLTKPWHHVWPYTMNPSLPSTSEQVSDVDFVWRQVWPYNSRSIAIATNGILSDSPEKVYRPSFVYPFINLYPPVYPYFDLYPALQRPANDTPSKCSMIRREVEGVRLNVEYPELEIYADVYPYNLYSIYPTSYRGKVPTAVNKSDMQSECLQRNKPRAPPINRQQGYPSFDLNPSSVIPPTGMRYPYFDIYPAVYPSFDLYPSMIISLKAPSNVSIETAHVQCNTGATCNYPNFNLYPAVYPYFDLYPALISNGVPEDCFVATSVDKKTPTQLSPMTRYPYFNLYPGVYPYIQIYPAIYDIKYLDSSCTSGGHGGQVMTAPGPVYPSFDLYPSLYPYLNPYPAPYGTFREVCPASEGSVVTQSGSLLGTGYPSFILYPSVYPYFDLYPAISFEKPDAGPKPVLPKHLAATCVRPDSHYPIFNIYPAIYPHIEIYPSLPQYPVRPHTSGKGEKPVSFSNHDSICVQPIYQYPIFNLYPAVYPYIDVYPSSPPTHTEPIHSTENPVIKTKVAQAKNRVPTPVQPNYRYPIFNLYPAIYPHIDRYPSLPQDQAPVVPATEPRVISSRLTHAELHAMVMMEKVGSVGSFGYLDHGNDFLGDNTHTMPRSSRQPDTSGDTKSGVPMMSRNMHTSSAPSSQEIRRISTAFKGGAYTLSQDRRITPAIYYPIPSSEIRPLQNSRSRSALPEKADIPLPFTTSITQGRAPSRSHSLRDQLHSTSGHIRKRDSLVLQRVKAYDTTGDYGFPSFMDLSNDNESPVETISSTRDTLSKFPMPPKRLPSFDGLQPDANRR